MSNILLRKLAEVAEHLDKKGNFKESDVVDSIINKLAAKSKKQKKSKKAKKDFDGDGKVETSDEEYKGSVDKAIKENKKK